jgi:hypothetical protein
MKGSVPACRAISSDPPPLPWVSEVSISVMPASMAASTTARVRGTSSRPPKLLPPRPATQTSSPLSPNDRYRMTLPSLEPTLDPVIVAAVLGRPAARPAARGASNGPDERNAKAVEKSNGDPVNSRFQACSALEIGAINPQLRRAVRAWPAADRKIRSRSTGLLSAPVHRAAGPHRCRPGHRAGRAAAARRVPGCPRNRIPPAAAAR